MDNKKKGNIIKTMMSIIGFGFLLVVLGINIEVDVVTNTGGTIFMIGGVTFLTMTFFKPFR